MCFPVARHVEEGGRSCHRRLLLIHEITFVKYHKYLFLWIFIVTCATAQAQQIDFNRLIDAGRDIASVAKGISEKEEIDIGRGLAGRMLGQVALVDDADVQGYVNRVGIWVASQSERPDLPWRFGVANAANINALAMPGGVILITRGLYDMLDNEAQLAGVLGHEIAHVVKRHHVNVMRQQRGVSAVANLAAARSGDNALRQALLDLFKNIFISGLDKNSEFEADAAGVILAARAGYNPFGLAEVLHKLNARGGKDPALIDLFGSHPPPSERIAKLGELLEPRLGSLPEGMEPALATVAAHAAPPGAKAAVAPGAKAFVNQKTSAKPAPAAVRAKPAPAPVQAQEDDQGSDQSAGMAPAEVAPDAVTDTAAAQKPASGGIMQGIRNLFGGSSGSASESAPAEAQSEAASEVAPAQKPASGGVMQGIRNLFGGGSTAKPAPATVASPDAPAENTEAEAAEGAAEEEPAQKPASKPSGGLMDGIRGIFGR